MAKTKALISCAVTAQLICVFVFAYANCWFIHAQAQLVVVFFTTTFTVLICMYMQKFKTLPHIFFHQNNSQLLFLITVSLMEAVAFSKDLTTYLAPQCQAFIGAFNEPLRGKTNNVVSEQVQRKPACTSTEKS